MSPCVLDGVWTVWQPWQSCSSSCGPGTRIRRRVCFGPVNGGKPCQGEVKDASTCPQYVSCPPQSKTNIRRTSKSSGAFTCPYIYS